MANYPANDLLPDGLKELYEVVKHSSPSDKIAFPAYNVTITWSKLSQVQAEALIKMGFPFLQKKATTTD